MNLRILLLGGALVATSACVTSQEWADWAAHPAHFASGDHYAFSMKNRFAPPIEATPDDVALAREQGWWGGPFEEPSVADVGGRWTGQWHGFGVFDWPRTAQAEAQFTQQGSRGEGRLVLADTLTADVPEVVSIEGLQGVRVALKVNGSTLVVKHEANGHHLKGVFKVDGDRMVGRFEGSTARIVLVRSR
ncbi:MAG: hypothetical protein HYU25_15865 [Candidatus Rokubacteria bacterium]|nr:hypothetical protein [Candidatus Rokubacteria bacterium]